LGLNEGTPDKAMAGARTMARLFSFAVKDGNSSTFAGASFEFMKKPYLGAHGHIGIATTSIARATAWLRRKGVGVKPETAKEKDGKLTAIYLDAEVGGFAVHLLQR
ncbi:MAG TPA: keto-hydroxyglutarate-aldolase/keto-deoxy-phosphogluconate aldolase, partial [bacterium]|nr:keto-hydroxyglutarate-aldolase/keto-deoxy-phosphogluconate aldolase [bacterium]